MSQQFSPALTHLSKVHLPENRSFQFLSPDLFPQEEFFEIQTTFLFLKNHIFQDDPGTSGSFSPLNIPSSITALCCSFPFFPALLYWQKTIHKNHLLPPASENFHRLRLYFSS